MGESFLRCLVADDLALDRRRTPGEVEKENSARRLRRLGCGLRRMQMPVKNGSLEPSTSKLTSKLSERVVRFLSGGS